LHFVVSPCCQGANAPDPAIADKLLPSRLARSHDACVCFPRIAKVPDYGSLQMDGTRQLIDASTSRVTRAIGIPELSIKIGSDPKF